MLCLDLDHFKDVNDTLGHPIGDALLQGGRRPPEDVVRETDTVARLGGDEFAIVQVGRDSRPRPPRWPRALIEAIERPTNSTAIRS